MNADRIEQCKADIAKLQEELKKLETSECPKSVYISCTLIGVNPTEKRHTGTYAPIRIKAANKPQWKTHEGYQDCHSHTIEEAKQIVDALNKMIDFCEENYSE